MIDIIIVGDFNQVTKAAIKSLKNSHYKSNSLFVEPFEGYNKSLNNGAKKGDQKYIAFCNNDLEFGKDWDLKIVSELERLKGTNIVSASPWCPSTHKSWWDKKPDRNTIGTATGRIVAGWCLVLRRSWWEEMGGFDERLRFWCCDNSYTMQLQRAKKDHILVIDSKVIHEQSVTLNQQSPEVYNDLTKMEVRRFNTYYDQNLFNLGKI